jgi:hypothetical protein
MIFNLLLGPYYGIIVTIGRERSRANEVTIVFNSAEAVLGHFDVPSQLMRTATLYSWPTRSRRTTTAPLQQRLQIFLKSRVFLAALAFARAKSTAGRRIENAGYRHRLFPAILPTGRDLVSGVLSFQWRAEKPLNPQIKLSFGLTLASPDMSPKH